MGLGERLGDGQPDPRAAPRPVTGGVGAVEPLEKVGQVLGGDALPVVGDGEHHRVSVGCGADVDVSMGRGVTQGVVEEIRQDLAHTLPVGPEPDRARHPGGQRHLFRRVPFGDGRRGGLDEFGDVDRFRGDGGVASSA